MVDDSGVTRTIDRAAAGLLLPLLAKPVIGANVGSARNAPTGVAPYASGSKTVLTTNGSNLLARASVCVCVCVCVCV